jgi:hypothetical protein
VSESSALPAASYQIDVFSDGIGGDTLRDPVDVVATTGNTTVPPKIEDIAQAIKAANRLTVLTCRRRAAPMARIMTFRDEKTSSPQERRLGSARFSRQIGNPGEDV